MKNSEQAYLAYQNWASTRLSAAPMISVVIPAYNEEWRILPTVGAIALHLSSLGQPWELIVADDGSTDNTVGLLLGLNWANLRLLVGTRNIGKGSAVRRGVQAASGELILIADADQSTPIEQLDMLVQQLHEGNYDVAVGSRAALGAEVSQKSHLRKVLSKGLQLLVRAGFGLEIRDTQCGFKLFRAEAAQQLFGLQVVDDFAFDLEVLYLCSKLDLRVLEVPVEWIDAPGSTVAAARVSLQFLSQLVRIRLRDQRGGYAGVPSSLPPGRAPVIAPAPISQEASS